LKEHIYCNVLGKLTSATRKTGARPPEKVKIEKNWVGQRQGLNGGETSP